MCQDVNYKEENAKKQRKEYCIYSIKRPGLLLNFWTLRVGAYSRWTLIQAGCLFKAEHLLNFHHFQQVVSLFCNKQ